MKINYFQLANNAIYHRVCTIGLVGWQDGPFRTDGIRDIQLRASMKQDQQGKQDRDWRI